MRLGIDVGEFTQQDVSEFTRDKRERERGTNAHRPIVRFQHPALYAEKIAMPGPRAAC